MGRRRIGLLALVAGLVAGLVVGGVIAAAAQSTTVALNAGDTAHVTCAGPSLSVNNQTSTALDLTCAPNPTTTTVSSTTTSTVAPTTTTTTVASGVVSEDQVAKAVGVGAVTATVSNSTPEVAIAFVAADDASPGQTVSVSGGGLAWVLAGRTNSQRGDAEVWRTVTAGKAFSATATPAQGAKTTQLTVITLAGSSGVGTVKGASATTGAPTISVTPTTTGSWVGMVGMDWDRAVNRTVDSKQTLDSQNTDAAGDTYWVQHANANTVAGVAVVLGDLSPTNDRWNLEAVEVTPATGTPDSTTTSTSTTTTSIAPSGNSPTLDPATPAIVPVLNNVSAVTSSAISPPANTVLYAVFSIDSLPGAGGLVSSVSNTGTPLTWQQTNLENHSFGTSVGGFVQVLWAANPGPQSNITVTANFNIPTKNVPAPVGGFQVLVIDNARADQSSAASQATWNVDSTSAPTATLNTTAANSLVMAVFDNWDSSATPTVPAGQTISSIVLNPVDQDTYWIQARTTATPTPAPVTMNATSPNNIHWHEIAWEILAS